MFYRQDEDDDGKDMHFRLGHTPKPQEEYVEGQDGDSGSDPDRVNLRKRDESIQDLDTLLNQADEQAGKEPDTQGY
jgi:hypothetical protein